MWVSIWLSVRFTNKRRWSKPEHDCFKPPTTAKWLESMNSFCTEELKVLECECGFSHLQSSSYSSLDMSFKMICPCEGLENKRSLAALHHMLIARQQWIKLHQPQRKQFNKLHFFKQVACEKRMNERLHVYYPWHRKWLSTELIYFVLTSQQLTAWQLLLIPLHMIQNKCVYNRWE